jgi:hypothetical protein
LLKLLYALTQLLYFACIATGRKRGKDIEQESTHKSSQQAEHQHRHARQMPGKDCQMNTREERRKILYSHHQGNGSQQEQHYQRNVKHNRPPLMQDTK